MVQERNLIRDLLVEDAALPTKERMFDRQVDPESITEQDLRDFGVLILDKYQQARFGRNLSQRLRKRVFQS